MPSLKKIKTALVSVYQKDGLDLILTKLNSLNVKLISTGGTHDFIKNLGFPCQSVKDLTGYPSILGGWVKTLHPKIFGDILNRRKSSEDNKELQVYDIPEIYLVIVDLYPFEDTVSFGANEQDIIEKIDIGGISLIRATAKNFEDVIVVSSKKQYPNKKAVEILSQKKNRIILVPKKKLTETKQFRSLLNGVLVQDKNLFEQKASNLKLVINRNLQETELEDMLFANKIVKHTKSNAIVLVKNKQLYASGMGQTSRVDALKQAIDKAMSFNFGLNGVVMASDVFSFSRFCGNSRKSRNCSNNSVGRFY